MYFLHSWMMESRLMSASASTLMLSLPSTVMEAFWTTWCVGCWTNKTIQPIKKATNRMSLCVSILNIVTQYMLVAIILIYIICCTAMYILYNVIKIPFEWSVHDSYLPWYTHYHLQYWDGVSCSHKPDINLPINGIWINLSWDWLIQKIYW